MTAQYTLSDGLIVTLDNSNIVAGGARLFVYEAGTSTLLNTYSDVALSIANSNPVEADANGRFPAIFLAPDDYKFICKSNDLAVTFFTQDNYKVEEVYTFSGGLAESGGVVQLSSAVNLQTGTSYTYVTGDKGKMVAHSNASPISATLPTAGTSFPNGWFTDITNIGVGALTITSASNIDGISSITLNQYEGIRIFSSGTTYYSERGAPSLIARAGANVTIASGAITIVAPFNKYLVDTESAAATDDLTDITAGSNGRLLILSIVNSARNVVIKNNTGSAGTKIINPRGQDITLDNVSDLVLLQYDLTQGAWIIISVSNINQKSIANYVSSDTAMPTHGTTQSFTHGLGGQPFMYSVWLVNVTTEGGYATGDAIMVSAFGDATSSPTTNLGITTYTNAANTEIIVRVSSDGVSLPLATVGEVFGITAANWTIRVKAFRFV